VRSEIVVVGAGGHAKVCIEILRAMSENPAVCVSGDDATSDCVGVPVVKGDEHLTALKADGYSRLFVAVGSNALRQRLADLGTRLGFQLVNAVSPQAIISPSARLGQGVAIMSGAVINAEAEIGDLAVINTGATVDHDCRIGHTAHIAPQCALGGNVIVGDHGFLGIGCKVIPEIEIGNHVTVGAGGVVVRDIPSHNTAVGVPARIMERNTART
jgi:UDP-perosamine 4-acetyltransferase